MYAMRKMNSPLSALTSFSFFSWYLLISPLQVFNGHIQLRSAIKMTFGVKITLFLLLILCYIICISLMPTADRGYLYHV